MVKIIFFDFYGVIVNNPNKVFLLFAEILYRISSIFSKTIIKDVDDFRKGIITEEEFRNIIHKKFKINVPRFFRKQVYKLDKKFTKTNKKMIETVHYLKSKGYKCVVLSDVFLTNKKSNRKKGFYEHFDDIILSCDIGLSKRDAVKNGTTEIFEYALNKHGFKPEEAIFIDDKVENCSVAKKLGMQTIVSQSPNQVIKDIFKLLNLNI